MASATASGTIVQTSASSAAFESGPNGSTNPVFRLVNNVASAASGVSITGRADGTAPTVQTISRTQQTASIAGNGLEVRADDAVAGSSTAGAAAGGNLNLQAGAAARLTSGNANGGNVNLIAGAGIGTGIQGQILANAYSASPWTQPQWSFVGGTGFGMGWNGGGRLIITAGGSGHIMANGFSVVLLNARPLYWSNSASDPDVADIGLNRHAANVLRVNPGGTTSPGAGAANLLIGTSAGAIGTSGAGVLAFTLSTEPSTGPTDTTQLYYKDFAAGDGRLYLRNEDDEDDDIDEEEDEESEEDYEDEEFDDDDDDDDDEEFDDDDDDFDDDDEEEEDEDIDDEE
jgi:hypothetical protein